MNDKYTIEEFYDMFKVSGIEFTEENLKEIIRQRYSDNELKRPEPVFGRRVGNTTRLIDYYVQKLFRGGIVKVKDHHEHRHADEDLTCRIMERLKREHFTKNISLIGPTTIKLNK